MSKRIISFNTGRGYTEAGQRIAATQLDDGRVVFVDVDRGIRYATAAPCELTQRAIMRAYDYDETENPSSDLFGGCWETREAAIAELEAAARAVQGVRS
jgi:S-methylmethionine-dependent homocysteine/selenocysteine methylase